MSHASDLLFSDSDRNLYEFHCSVSLAVNFVYVARRNKHVGLVFFFQSFPFLLIFGRRLGIAFTLLPHRTFDGRTQSENHRKNELYLQMHMGRIMRFGRRPFCTCFTASVHILFSMIFDVKEREGRFNTETRTHVGQPKTDFLLSIFDAFHHRSLIGRVHWRCQWQKG